MDPLTQIGDNGHGLPLWWRPRAALNRNRFLRIIPTPPARRPHTSPIGVGISGDCPGRILRSAVGFKYHLRTVLASISKDPRRAVHLIRNGLPIRFGGEE